MNENEDGIKIGSVVVLKSGSAKMTVSNRIGSECSCCWMIDKDRDKRMTGKFHVETLVLSTEAP